MCLLGFLIATQRYMRSPFTIEGSYIARELQQLKSSCSDRIAAVAPPVAGSACCCVRVLHSSWEATHLVNLMHQCVGLVEALQPAEFGLKLLHRAFHPKVGQPATHQHPLSLYCEFIVVVPVQPNTAFVAVNSVYSGTFCGPCRVRPGSLPLQTRRL